MMALGRQRMTVGLFVAALFAVHFLLPRAQELRYQFENPDTTVESRNEEFRAMKRVLSGRRTSLLFRASHSLTRDLH